MKGVILNYKPHSDSHADQIFWDVFEKSEDAILLLKDEKFIACNHAAVAMLGASDKSQVLNTHPADLSPEMQANGQRSADLAPDIIERALADSFLRFEWQHRRFDGRDFPCEVTLTKTVVNGEIILYTTWRDLTRQRQLEIDRACTEARLRDSEERFNLATKGSGVGIWDWDPVADKVLYTESFKKVLGCNLAEDTGPSSLFSDRIHPYFRQKYFKAIRKTLLKGPGQMDVECKARHEDGHYVWLQIAGTALRDKNGFTTRALGKIVDITRQKESEIELTNIKYGLEALVEERTRELEHKHGQLIAAINALEQGFVLYNTEGVIEAVNKQAGLYHIRAQAEFKPGTNIIDLVEQSFPDACSQEKHRVVDAVLHADPVEERHLDDGRIVKITRCKTPDGGTIAMMTDITEFRRQEELMKKQAVKLITALNREKELNEMQRRFLAMASHEFRTPLAIIDGLAHRLDRYADDGRLTPEIAQDKIEKIRDSIARMTRLMDSTLSAARMQAGKFTINRTACDLEKILKDVCDRQQSLTSAHKIRLRMDNLPATIHADAQALEQIMGNLLNNAVKYTPDSPDIDVEASCDGDQVDIRVKDKGVGIHAQDVPHVFNQFFRARNSIGVHGTGLGLSLVEMLTEKHNGTITVESHLGKGSVFILKLPVKTKKESMNDYDLEPEYVNNIKEHGLKS
jgi:PAS domain S-box-containing protein